MYKKLKAIQSQEKILKNVDNGPPQVWEGGLAEKLSPEWADSRRQKSNRWPAVGDLAWDAEGAWAGSPEHHRSQIFTLCPLLLFDFLEPLAFKAGPTPARIRLPPAGHSQGEARASSRWCPLACAFCSHWCWDVGWWQEVGSHLGPWGGRPVGVGATQGKCLCHLRSQVVPGLPDSGLFLLQEMKISF